MKDNQGGYESFVDLAVFTVGVVGRAIVGNEVAFIASSIVGLLEPLMFFSNATNPSFHPCVELRRIEI